MHRLCSIFLLLSVVAFTNAAETLFPAQEKPTEFANQEGCYLKEMHRVIPYGDSYLKKSCSMITCHANNTTEVFTCDVEDVKEDRRCRLISNESADYPECCPVLMCSTFPPEAWKDMDGSTEAPGALVGKYQ